MEKSILQSKEIVSNFGSLEEQKPFSRIPSVTMFQPTSYEIVTPDKLREFELLVADRLGIHLETDKNISYTVSCCPDCDDCDE